MLKNEHLYDLSERTEELFDSLEYQRKLKEALSKIEDGLFQ